MTFLTSLVLLISASTSKSNCAITIFSAIITIPCYSLDTFVANGGIPKITSIVGITSIYDIEFQISRTHKGTL